MATLAKLDYQQHGKLRVKADSSLTYASSQHVLHLRAVEMGKAACHFPIFCGRHAQTGDWMILAMTALEQSSNLFTRDADEWASVFKPTSLETYPLFLVTAEDEERGFAIGIDENSPSLSTDDGEALFDSSGESSLYLNRMSGLLTADIENDVQTRHFLLDLERAGLFRPIDIVVHYKDGGSQTITDLHTIDEDRLQALSAESVVDYARRGFLLLIHAMLVSIYQLNHLVGKHNRVADSREVEQVKLGVARSAAETGELL